MPDPLIGTYLGDYRIEGVFGKGAMGVVYRARRLSLDQLVALKVLPAHLAEDEAFRARFKREWQLAASLSHPNILPILDAGEADGRLYLAMQPVEGGDLHGMLVRNGPLEPARALDMLGQVAAALDAAHARELIHRDVKPANILIATNPEPDIPDHVYLADFGLTRRSASESRLSSVGTFVGTYHYAAPEQFGSDEIDRRVDIYALGCVLFQCLTGRVPFDVSSEAALMKAHLQQPVPPLASVRPGLPEGLDRVIARATAKDPQDRYPTARALIADAREEVRRAAELATVIKPGGIVATVPAPSVALSNGDVGRDTEPMGPPLPGPVGLSPSVAGSAGSVDIIEPADGGVGTTIDPKRRVLPPGAPPPPRDLRLLVAGLMALVLLVVGAGGLLGYALGGAAATPNPTANGSIAQATSTAGPTVAPSSSASPSPTQAPTPSPGPTPEPSVSPTAPQEPTISIESASKSEGSSDNTMTFTVSLSFASDRDVVVAYRTDPAVSGDFATVQDALIKIPAGETTATIPIVIHGDRAVEPDIEFTVILEEADGAVIGEGRATGIITNDDVAPTRTPTPDPVISLAGGRSGSEGGGSLRFTVTLSSATSHAVTFSYITVAGTAKNGSDYQGGTRTGRIPAGSRSTTVSIPLVNDRTHEGTESFTVKLTRASGARLSTGVVRGTITDNDPIPVANRAPRVTNDTFNAASNVYRNWFIFVLDNDSDPDGDRIRISQVSQSTYGGTVLITTHSSRPGKSVIRYHAPDCNHSQDYFYYWVTDGHGHTVRAKTTVNLPSC